MGVVWRDVGRWRVFKLGRSSTAPQEMRRELLANTSLYLFDCAVLLTCTHQLQDLAAQSNILSMPTPLDRAASQRVGDFWSWNLIYVVCILVMRDSKC